MLLAVAVGAGRRRRDLRVLPADVCGHSAVVSVADGDQSRSKAEPAWLQQADRHGAHRARLRVGGRDWRDRSSSVAGGLAPLERIT